MTKTEKAWAGRFSKSSDPDLENFSRSIDIDRRMWRQDIAVNRAWAEALLSIKIYSKAEYNKVSQGLDRIQREFEEDKFSFRDSDEDIHMAIERRLTELTGDAGARIHTGRSRNDQVMTDVRLFLKEQLLLLEGEMRELQSVLADLAEQHIDVVMPGYTHLQQAQPILLSHYLLSLFWPLQRDLGRLDRIADLADELPLGSGALAGSAFPVDRKVLAVELGFSRISPNSIDAVSDRDILIDTANLCSMIMIHLSRYAEDFILWSGHEFGFLELPDEWTTGSSMMPQKKNPDSLELIRGKSARVIGQSTALQVLLKGLPLAYSRDLQEDKPPLFEALDQTMAAIQVFRKTLAGATFKSKRMKAALDDLLLATDLADYLTRKGIPFRKAHHAAGSIVLDSIRTRVPISEMSIEALKKHSGEIESDIYECLTIEASLAARNIIGGTGAKAVRKQIRQARLALKKHSTQIEHNS